MSKETITEVINMKEKDEEEIDESGITMSVQYMKEMSETEIITIEIDDTEMIDMTLIKKNPIKHQVITN
jgi:hypothetical protein